MNEQKWLCEECRFVLGHCENSGKVRIKRKDLYITVEGGRVTEICPRCGKVNILTDDKMQSPQAVNLQEKSL